MGAASFLGVAQPTVPVGEAVFSVLTGTLDVGTPRLRTLRLKRKRPGSFSANGVDSTIGYSASFFYSGGGPRPGSQV